MEDAVGGRHLTEQILEDHRRIRSLLERIDETRDLADLLRRLSELRPMLARHFIDEEAPDGFYDNLRTTAPRHMMKIVALQHQHSDFLENIPALLARAQACLDGPVAAVLKDVHALVTRLREHERREDDLLFDTIYTDLGQGDG
ncbi:MAG: hemerythrin domain-containing protein [Candidatus Rokubacteria bacterium]|nr:hemerythrin domain-containing protein [Candidatus Rokubacteria bacterium]